MKVIQAFLKGQDAFGQPVTINYRGDAVYKTALGGVLTVAQRIFILIVATIGVIDLFSYKDPNITQYKIYDKREDGTELNFGELKGGFWFGLQDIYSTDENGWPLFVPVDPKYATLNIFQWGD